MMFLPHNKHCLLGNSFTHVCVWWCSYLTENTHMSLRGLLREWLFLLCIFPLRAGFVARWISLRLVTDSREKRFPPDTGPVTALLRLSDEQCGLLPLPATRDCPGSVKRYGIKTIIQVPCAYAYLRLRWSKSSFSSTKWVDIQEMSSNTSTYNGDNITGASCDYTSKFTSKVLGGGRFLDETISLGSLKQPRAFQGSSHDVRFYVSTAVTIKGRDAEWFL
jgi:hypothetical protein